MVCFRGIEYFGSVCLLYMAGLFYRAMTVQTGLIGACYCSVHYWVCIVQGGKGAEGKARGCVAVDETKLKVNGRHVFVWAAVDARELLAIYACQRYPLTRTCS